LSRFKVQQNPDRRRGAKMRSQCRPLGVYWGVPDVKMEIPEGGYLLDSGDPNM
jgi:hypothetical protein